MIPYIPQQVALGNITSLSQVGRLNPANAETAEEYALKNIQLLSETNKPLSCALPPRDFTREGQIQFLV